METSSSSRSGSITWKGIPDVQIVMVVRDPLENALGSICGYAHKISAPFSRMDWQRLADKYENYQDTRYSETIPLWDKIFGERMVYLPFDLMRRNPDKFFRQMFGKLDPKLKPQPVKARLKLQESGFQIPPLIMTQVIQRTERDGEFLKNRFPEEFTRLCQK